jgi:hypothetical protein
MKRRFGWPQVVADVVLHAYTNWSALGHPESNRDSYIQVGVPTYAGDTTCAEDVRPVISGMCW